MDYVETSGGPKVGDRAKKFQEGLGTPREAINHSQGLLHEARRHLGIHVPQALPAQPAVIVVEQGDMYGGGEYLGELGGIHYLEIGFGRKPEVMDPTKRETLLTLAIHELVHQKQFETPNIAGSLPAQDTLTPDELAKLTPQQTIELLRKRKEALNSSVSDVQSAILEGSAMQVEFYILRKRIEAASAAGDRQQVELLTEVHQERLDLLTDDQRANGTDGGYFEGSKMVSDLINTFGVEKLFTVIQAIDYQQLVSIKAGTPEYAAIIANPRSLPGLKNHVNHT